MAFETCYRGWSTASAWENDTPAARTRHSQAGPMVLRARRLPDSRTALTHHALARVLPRETDVPIAAALYTASSYARLPASTGSIPRWRAYCTNSDGPANAALLL
jgi:hypothetical protein